MKGNYDLSHNKKMLFFAAFLSAFSVALAVWIGITDKELLLGSLCVAAVFIIFIGVTSLEPFFHCRYTSVSLTDEGIKICGKEYSYDSVESAGVGKRSYGYTLVLTVRNGEKTHTYNVKFLTNANELCDYIITRAKNLASSEKINEEIASFKRRSGVSAVVMIVCTVVLCVFVVLLLGEVMATEENPEATDLKKIILLGVDCIIISFLMAFSGRVIDLTAKKSDSGATVLRYRAVITADCRELLAARTDKNYCTRICIYNDGEYYAEITIYDGTGNAATIYKSNSRFPTLKDLYDGLGIDEINELYPIDITDRMDKR